MPRPLTKIQNLVFIKPRNSGVGRRLSGSLQYSTQPPSKASITQEQRQEALPYTSIPGPTPWPLLGNKLLFTPLGGYSSERVWESSWKFYRQYGPIVKVSKLSSKFDMVLVFHPEDTQKIYKSEGKLPVRPVLDILDYYRKRHPHLYTSPGLVPGNGEEWKRLRVCVHSLLRLDLVQKYKAPQAGVASDLVRALDDLRVHHEEGLVTDLLPLLFRYTLEAIGVVSLGTRLGCLDSAHSTSGAQTRAQSIIKANEEFLTVLGESFFSPPFYRLFPTRAYKRLVSAQGTIASVVKEQLELRRAEYLKEPEAFKEKHPFLASLLEREDLALSDVFLLLVEVFQGGIDATATTLGFCLHFLAKDERIQMVLYNEVKDVQLETHTLQGLPYMRAVVQETMRLRPSAGGRSRVIQEDAVICGYHVPAGTFINSPPVVACHDPSVFPDPDQFRPERWLRPTQTTGPDSTPPSAETTPTQGAKVHPYTILPFGHGARMCPGRRVAEQEVFLALVRVVQAFRMECDGKDPGQVCRLNMMPDAPFSIKFSPR